MFETQINLSMSLKMHFKVLFVRILLVSANPKREWSVKTHLIPIVLAWIIPS